MGRTVPGLMCLLASVSLAACSQQARPADPLDGIATRYVRLADALVRQDDRSASGDSSLVSTPGASAPERVSLDAISAHAHETIEALRSLDTPAGAGPRAEWLHAQLLAIETRARQQAGKHIELDEEFTRLYGVELPTTPEAGDSIALRSQALDDARTALEAVLPGTGTPAERLDAFDSTVTVPTPRLPAVFEAALDECRRRSRELLTLPPGEHVTVRYVVGEPWSGFSAYQGGGESVISVNTSYPLTVDRVLQLACHEGYPGHHVINVLRDHARDKRPELSAVPLFSPEAFATEAIATQATRLVFSDEERTAFERDTLFPLAGLPAAAAARHVQVARLVEQLGPAVSDALRRFLTGEQGLVETAWMLQRDAFMQHPRATLEFAAAFRGLALAYGGGAPTTRSPGAQWLREAGYPSEPVIMAGNGHHSSASSYRK